MAFRVRRQIIGDIHRALRECESLVRDNVDYLSLHPFTAPVLLADVTYFFDDGDTYSDIPEMLANGGGDCEDFAAWLAAEDRVRRRFDKLSKVAFIRRPHWKKGRYHAVTVRFDTSHAGEWEPYVILRKKDFILIDPCIPHGMQDYIRQKRKERI